MPRARRAVRAGLVWVIMISLLAMIGCTTQRRPLPGQQRCVATASGRSVTISTEQAQYASIIAGISVRRGLTPRAASIALTTAYQESGIRNLDYGDRDSVGLFQQRPSQGWGARKQLMNPHYATKKFYDALVEVEDWENRDITEIAQEIQISGYPDAYRDHEADGRVLASVFTGYSPAGLRCLIREDRRGRPGRLVKSLRKTYGVEARRDDAVLTVTAPSAELAWSYGQYGLAAAHRFGVTTVQVGDRQLDVGSRLRDWQQADDPVRATRVRLTLG